MIVAVKYLMSFCISKNLPFLTIAVALSFSLSVYSQGKKPTAAVMQFRSITVVSQPNAIVWLDGVRFGKTGKDGKLTIKTVSSGAHTLRVRADGYKERSQPLTAVQKGEVKIDLVKTADVRLTSDRVATGIKLALDEAGIDMPYPHSVVLFHDTTGTRDGDIERAKYMSATTPRKPG